MVLAHADRETSPRSRQGFPEGQEPAREEAHTPVQPSPLSRKLLQPIESRDDKSMGAATLTCLFGGLSVLRA